MRVILASALAFFVAAPVLAGPPVLQPEAPGRLRPDRTVDLVALDLRLHLDTGTGRIDGQARWTTTVLRDGLRWLVLDQEGLQVSRVTVNGEDRPFELGSGTLRVDLGTPKEHGASLQVTIHYAAKPGTGLHHRQPGPTSSDRHIELWSQGEAEDNRHWIPTWDHPGDRFRYEGTFTAPAGSVIVSNGTLKEKGDDPKGVRAHYVLEPGDLVSYLVMVAAGPYRVAATTGEGVALQSFAGPDAAAGALEHANRSLPAMLRLFAETTGLPYPFADYRQVFVQRFLYGGMENTTSTVLDRRHLSARFGSESTLAHELAHQWFGDILTCADWTHLWLNEGFATYWADLWEHHALGGDSWAETWDHRVQGLIDADKRGAVPMVARFYSRQGERDNAHVYTRGATVLQMLRNLLGDKVFFAGIRQYVADNRFALVETDDLRRAMEQQSGRDLSWFFDQWAYLSGHPKLRVETKVGEDGLRITAKAQPGKEGWPNYSLPLDLEVATTAGVTRHRLWVEGGGGTLLIPGTGAPLWVAVDPNGGLLADIDHKQDEAAWIRQIQSPSPSARRAAVVALGRPDRPVGNEAKAAIAALARDEGKADALRRAAADTLGHWGETAAMLVLTEVLSRPVPRRDDPARTALDADLRLAFASALGDAKDATTVITTLDQVLRADPDEGVRAAALRSLHKVLGKEVLNRAITATRSGATERMALVTAGIDVLAQVGDISHVGALAASREAKQHPHLLHTALHASATLVDRAEPSNDRELARAAVVRDASALLDDPFLRTRQSATAVIARIGIDSAVPQLQARLAIEADPDLRQSLRDAIDACRARDPKKKEERPGETESRLRAIEERLDAQQKRLDEASARH